MKVYLYINKEGFKANTFRLAFKELATVVSSASDGIANYLIGKCEVKDADNSYEVPYNKKYEGRYFALPIDDCERGFFNLTTIICNNDLSDYPVINEATLNRTIDTLFKEGDVNQSTAVSLEYVSASSKDNQKIIDKIASSSFISMINMLNVWAKEEQKDLEIKLQIDFF